MQATLPLVLPDDVYNQRLVENVHPPAWHNPTPSGRYNLVVIGAGTAGLVAAGGAAMLGAKVALIEHRLMGGDCLNYGCVPSKALLRAARAAQAVREAPQYGIDEGGHMHPDFTEIMTRMRRLRAEISVHDSAQRFAGMGVDVFLGRARFVASDSIEVGGQRLPFSKAIIATGGRPAAPSIPGLAEAGFVTNETIFSLTELPRRLVVIGGGPIGCELAQAFRRFGSEVTILTNGSQLLPREHPDAAVILARCFEREGIQVVLRAKIERVQPAPNGKIVIWNTNGHEQEMVGDEILVAVGRAPNVEGLDLNAAGVEFDRNGVKVDDRLRTTNSKVYAAGDVCSSYKFTHAADAMARTALQNALFFGRKKASSLVIPWCTYTDPEIARIGLSESEARTRGYKVATYSLPLAETDRSVLDGETEGFARINVDKNGGRIVGATLVSRHAGESIGEIVLAMKEQLKAGVLGSTIHPYPTQAEIWKRLGDEYMRNRFRPWMKGLLKRYFAWKR